MEIATLIIGMVIGSLTTLTIGGLGILYLRSSLKRQVSTMENVVNDLFFNNIKPIEEGV